MFGGSQEESVHKGWREDGWWCTNEQTRRKRPRRWKCSAQRLIILEASITRMTEDNTEWTEAVAELDTGPAVQKRRSISEIIAVLYEAQVTVAQA